MRAAPVAHGSGRRTGGPDSAVHPADTGFAPRMAEESEMRERGLWMALRGFPVDSFARRAPSLSPVHFRQGVAVAGLVWRRRRGAFRNGVPHGGSPSSRRVRIHVSGWRLPRRARHLEQGAKVLGHREMLSEDYRLSLERVMRVLDFLNTNTIILINIVILGKVMQCYH